MWTEVDHMLIRIGELESQLRSLEAKVHDLEVELRGNNWGLSNMNADLHDIQHYQDLPDDDGDDQAG